MKKAVLLVEGQADVAFFQALLRWEKLDHVEITPPTVHGKRTDTVSHFPSLINKMDTGDLDQLAIVADADYVSGGGVQQRWETLTGCLKKEGYRIPESLPKLPFTGSIFKHPDGLPPVGLWLMPDHQNNGMLEDLLLQTLTPDPAQKTLLDFAEQKVGELPHKLFSEYHHSKAILYSWLAWQKRPGQSLDVPVNGKLLDFAGKSLSGFLKWLHTVFES